MQAGAAAVIDNQFGPAAQAFFASCVEQARGLVPEMRKSYHGVRKGHLQIYKQMVLLIRKEASFPELLKQAGLAK